MHACCHVSTVSSSEGVPCRVRRNSVARSRERIALQGVARNVDKQGGLKLLGACQPSLSSHTLSYQDDGWCG